MMDYSGQVYTSNDVDFMIISTIRSLAYRNEAGAFNPNGYEPGEYTVKYLYQVRPPLEHDDDYSHLNLKLADDHVPYKKVRVEIENREYIERIYAHPPTLKRTEDRNYVIFTGDSAEDELLEFEFLMTTQALNQIEGYPAEIDNIRERTVNANNRYMFEYLVATGFLWFNKLAIFLTPVGLYMFWNWYGKEKEYVVPEFLSTVPNKLRKPWIVNLIF